MSTITIVLSITTGVAFACFIVHIFVAHRQRENLIRYYENQRNERLQQELEDAKQQWNRDNARMKEELGQLIEKQIEPFKNLKDKFDRS